VQIDEPTQVTQELHRSLADLIRQLSADSAVPTMDDLIEMVASPATVLFVARLDGQIVGTLTLALFRAPSALRARIEDVVVAEASRGRGVGSALTRAALDRARDLGARTVELTSRPARSAANAMYQRLGFQLRNTNVYRYEFSDEPPERVPP
jgi:ribosomal protein S18 acetylase RimI-like enzyme